MSEKMPPWVDIDTLCWAICASPNSVENYVAQGKLPPPRKLGSKRLWNWKEVDEWLAGKNDAPAMGSITDAVRKAVAGR
jgi:predicted DNA-binding transcriptional regulator AlpA